ncbi:MAG: hypothetical protein V7L01_34835, partial [Nostoc sp.]|uniref:hypothetical protein n=1 Tax=Nostoc sp. TaxID=1180 RepID=UPI002FFB86E6
IILAYTCLFIDDACGVRSDRLFGKTFWFTDKAQLYSEFDKLPASPCCSCKDSGQNPTFSLRFPLNKTFS